MNILKKYFTYQIHVQPLLKRNSLKTNDTFLYGCEMS